MLPQYLEYRWQHRVSLSLSNIGSVISHPQARLVPGVASHS